MATSSKAPKKKSAPKAKTAKAKKPGPMQETASNTGGTFDMYHFFNRWDVIIAVVVITLILLYLISHHLGQVGA